VLSVLLNYNITSPGVKWYCADGFEGQSYYHLAACVGNYPELVVIAQVSDLSCRMCDIYKCMLMEHSTEQPLNNSNC
jgi:hypothetical protein